MWYSSITSLTSRIIVCRLNFEWTLMTNLRVSSLNKSLLSNRIMIAVYDRNSHTLKPVKIIKILSYIINKFRLFVWYRWVNFTIHNSLE